MIGDIQLAHDGWQAVLRPGVGGAVAGLSWNGDAVLQPAADDSSDVLEMACFPLLPYANRIAHGRFSFAGRAHQLPTNFGTHPHSLHGTGWKSVWEVSELSTDSACLTHTHAGSADWPWPYQASQRIRLEGVCFTMAVSITNRCESRMPAGLGLHPSFPLDPTTRLTAVATGTVLTDETAIPTGVAAASHFADWSKGSLVADASPVDHAHGGWNGCARIDQPRHAILIETEGQHAFHLFVPKPHGHFCFEPVSHLPDALNRPEFAIDALDPGESLTLQMRLTLAGQAGAAPRHQ